MIILIAKRENSRDALLSHFKNPFYYKFRKTDVEDKEVEFSDNIHLFNNSYDVFVIDNANRKTQWRLIYALAVGGFALKRFGFSFIPREAVVISTKEMELWDYNQSECLSKSAWIEQIKFKVKIENGAIMKSHHFLSIECGKYPNWICFTRFL